MSSGEPKCFAADGKEPIINAGFGYPLMVSAVSFNRLVAELEMTKSALGACQSVRSRLDAEREADRAAKRAALAALEIGRCALQAQADAFHCAMRGYKPAQHEAMDAEVRQADAAISLLKERIE